MEKILREIFGTQLKFYQKKEVKLPLYLMDDRTFFDVEIYGLKFVLIILPDGTRFNAGSLKKQNTAYERKFQLQVAFGFQRITTFQRKSMIENHLPFIAENGQIFLPFIGTFFTKCSSKEILNTEVHFTPASQMLFLLLLYGKDDLWINKSQAAKMLGITPMSVSRAAVQLQKLAIIEEKNTGTETRIHRTMSRMAAYERAVDYLLDPIQKIIYVSEEGNSELKITAGDYALSFRSDLGYPDYMEYASGKNVIALNGENICDPELVPEVEAIKVQVWKYSPELFAMKDTVDPVSLICSYKNNREERIHKCLENIKKEIETWQIEI